MLRQLKNFEYKDNEILGQGAFGIVYKGYKLFKQDMISIQKLQLQLNLFLKNTLFNNHN